MSLSLCFLSNINEPLRQLLGGHLLLKSQNGTTLIGYFKFLGQWPYNRVVFFYKIYQRNAQTARKDGRRRFMNTDHVVTSIL